MPRRRKVPDPEDIALAVLDACAARVAAEAQALDSTQGNNNYIYICIK